MYRNVTQAPPFDRSEKNGLRCVKYFDEEAIPRDAFDPYRRDAVRDLYTEKPVSDEVFAVYRDQFSYDPLELDSRIEVRDEDNEDWIRERVSFDAVYGGERVIAQLFLPRRARAPFQTVIYFPGSMALDPVPSEELEDRIEFTENLSFIMKAGRALLYPIYKGTHERAVAPWTRPGVETHEYANWQVQLVKDMRRSLDYLESRPDIDREKMAYYGFSWGGRMASLILAVEPRFKAAIVYSGGLRNRSRTRPEVDLLHYAPRVRTPLLMLHGRYDLAVTLDGEAQPMFDLLGTPEPHKVLYVVDSDHFIPRSDLVRESLQWLDTYLGPVELAGQPQAVN